MTAKTTHEWWKDHGITQAEWAGRELINVATAHKMSQYVFNPSGDNPCEPCNISYSATLRQYIVTPLFNPNGVQVLGPSSSVHILRGRNYKLTSGKPKASKLADFPHALKVLVEIMDYGETTHPDKKSWESGDPQTYLDKFYRHACLYGPTDPESKLDSLKHAFTNLAIYFELKGRQGAKT